MAYRFGYVFKKDRLEKKGKLYLVEKQKGKIPDTTGSFILGEQKIFITKEKNQDDRYVLKSIAGKLKGIIKERSGDTLFIKFWDITNESDSFKTTGNFVNENNNGKDFIFIIDSMKYDTSIWAKGKFLDIPFRFNQFMATNLPFRVLTKSGNLESDFLNANIAYQFVSGSTRIFDSEFVEPRNRYFAYGPYLGLSSIDNPDTQKKEFGLNYGINAVVSKQGLNIIIAYGFQNGFKTGTKEVQPYLGFGIGFELVETFNPEIKTKGK